MTTFAIALGFEFRLIKNNHVAIYDGDGVEIKRFPTPARAGSGITIRTSGNEFVEFCGLRFVNRQGVLWLQQPPGGDDVMVAQIAQDHSYQVVPGAAHSRESSDDESAEREEREREREEGEREKEERRREKEREKEERQREKEERQREKEERQREREERQREKEREKEERQREKEREKEERQREREERQREKEREREEREDNLRKRFRSGHRGTVVQTAQASTVSQISDGFVREMIQTINTQAGERVVVNKATKCIGAVQGVTFA